MEPAKPAVAIRRPHGTKLIRWIIVSAICAVLLWCGIDLYGPRSADMRVFDPLEVARLDTAMWRSYYDRQHLKLFLQLAELMRRQFHFPFLRSHVAAFNAARAAFIFKDGSNRTDYQRALPDLVRYFRAIRAVSITPFDEPAAARLELEWWIVHREREKSPAGDLERALAEAAAALYREPPEKMGEYARMRAEAMRIRDARAAAGGVTAQDWSKIEECLRGSWQSLWKAVQP